MTFDELIERGWERHAEAPGAIAALLEQHAALATDAAQAAALLRLANHTLGEHLRDWPRAAAYATAIVGTVPGAGAAAGPLTSLAVACFMSGATLDALAAQTRIVALDAGSAASVAARIAVEVAANSIAAGALDDGGQLYAAALALARAHADAATVRAVAITTNGLASDLLARSDRDDAETRVMLDAAHASREFWLKCGTWVNEARADYLLALVYNAAGQAEIARGHGEHALAQLEAHGDEKVDEAFAHLALANSSRLLGDRPGYDRHLAQADRLAAAFADEGLTTWFAGERRGVVWAGQA
jgi:hypothetical protein